MISNEYSSVFILAFFHSIKMKRDFACRNDHKSFDQIGELIFFIYIYAIH